MSDDLNRTPADETNAHLSGEDAQPHATPPASEQPGPTPVERAAGMAREQAGEAASALRRGEFMQDAGVDPAADKDDKLIALLSYATQIVIPVVMPVIVLLSESSKKRPFQRYHAVQSLALMLLFVVIGVAVSIGTAVFQIVPLLGQLLGVLVLCLTPIAYLMAVVALLYYGYQAYQGKRFAIPGLTSFLRDQGWID
ncbi:MAG: DUF4870 domain-containing protein [Caldilineaceae bacterium]|nr:DUF4870 domain-containing protein [Caldilineaceae bacterium]